MRVARIDKYRFLLRLPIYILLPASVMFYIMDYSFYRSSGPDESIYADVTTRFGISGGVEVFLLAMYVGSIMLFMAMGTIVINSAKRRRIDWGSLLYLMVGVLSHPWVFNPLLDRLLRR